MRLIKDEEFIRGKAPMTKEDIRALSIWKMNLSDKSNVLDIGSGTGTITVQSAMIAKDGKVYSIERDEEAYNTSIKNIQKFKANNVLLEKGEAKDILDKYIEDKLSFDSIFIGGSGGDLELLIEKSDLLLKNQGTLVMNFITLNNAYKGIEKVKSLKYETEITAVNISKSKENSYMMIANNPIYIISCYKGEV
ncbi:precorrin-6Y C5,15-methyltransferase (decarboxylating) subunit CbiT [Clostridium sp. Sa3CUN1]|uniref:Precorrin-6Y C5,15-methyltransferase (Decarboxylating) subunit CbiT n=1 Tax=Clostridium gallinarum TaxID=2762246 RepID=A0ABR8Q4C1_9CLOT|nr:precorrin-6Y C5,15-methyltransferase (decarboxylating) subunit CbiT [Clostridium gallinarum]MBD7915275.1 precorrin-6Y C5,15-methyltransferase (decarboxylating) subunit CbiT [Clostridium gallinarum]